MRKLVVAVLAIASVAAGAAWAADCLAGRKVVVVQVTPPPPEDAANYRKPLLKAAGSEPVKPGQERITIPVDGVAYEVVVTRPNPLGMLIPVDH